MGGRSIIGGWLFALAALVAPSIARASDANEAGQISVRPATDGAGPSHLLIVGKFLLVVDPLKAKIWRYSLQSFGNNDVPSSCTFSRDFLPWRSIVRSGVTVLVSEDESTTMLLSEAAVGAMAGGNCPGEVKAASGDIAPPTFIRGSTAAIVTLANPSGGPRLKIDAKRSGSILEARILRTLADGRSFVFWKRLEALPVFNKPGDDPASYRAQGRVFVSLFISTFARDGKPLDIHRVRDFNFVSVGDGYQAAYTGMKKRGFEYLTVDDAGMVYGLTSVGHDFVVKRFNILSVPGSQVALASDTSGVKDNEGGLADGDPGSDQGSGGTSYDKWKRDLDAAAGRYIKMPWELPVGGMATPCVPKNGRPVDRCTVMYRAGQLVARDEGAVASGAALPVKNGSAIAEWARPSYLIGRNDGYTTNGMPYSYGGNSSISDFAPFKPDNRSTAVYRGTPFGHIVENLTIADGSEDGGVYISGSYPLGIDCSHLVNRLIAYLGSTTAVVPAAGTKIRIPKGYFDAPIEHPKDLRPGDILVKDGHVVIFVRTIVLGQPAKNPTPAKGSSEGPIGYVVYEATSRCGRVCRSVYGLDFFNGWWMVRPRTMNAAGGDANPYREPKWVSRAAATRYPAATQ